MLFVLVSSSVCFKLNAVWVKIVQQDTPSLLVISSIARNVSMEWQSTFENYIFIMHFFMHIHVSALQCNAVSFEPHEQQLDEGNHLTNKTQGQGL